MVSPGRGIKSLSNTVPVMIYNIKCNVVVPPPLPLSHIILVWREVLLTSSVGSLVTLVAPTLRPQEVLTLHLALQIRREVELNINHAACRTD